MSNSENNDAAPLAIVGGGGEQCVTMDNSENDAALYARVSSDRQARDGTIASQLEDLLARARADGRSIPPEFVYSDDGYSGASLVRPALVSNGEIGRNYFGPSGPDRNC